VVSYYPTGGFTLYWSTTASTKVKPHFIASNPKEKIWRLSRAAVRANRRYGLMNALITAVIAFWQPNLV
ncbi:MAG TPA: hypothetical protein GYA11_05410, partial [Firmicutes bacterium]|nr:hypothetical protein [Bacillota bacterium]